MPSRTSPAATLIAAGIGTVFVCGPAATGCVPATETGTMWLGTGR